MEDDLDKMTPEEILALDAEMEGSDDLDSMDPVEIMALDSELSDSDTVEPALSQNSNPPTALSAIVHGAGSGLAYSGFDEALGATGDQAALERFKASEAEYPALFATSEFVSSLLSPNPNFAGKAFTVGKSAGRIAQFLKPVAKAATNAAAGGAIAGFLRGEGLEDRAEKALEGATIGSITGAGFTAVAKGISAVARKAGDLIVKNGKQIFNVSEDLQKALGSDEVTGMLQADRLKAKQIFQRAIDEDKAAIGSKIQSLTQDLGDVPVSVVPAFSSAVNKLNKLSIPEIDANGQNALIRLKNIMKASQKDMLSKSASKSLEDVPFPELLKQRQALGEQLFGPNRAIYAKAPEVRAIANGLYAQLNRTLDAAAKKQGVAEFPDLNAAYHGLVTAKPQKLTAATVMGSANKSGAALEKLSEKVLSPSLAKAQAGSKVKQLFQKYAPSTTRFLDTDLPEMQFLSKVNEIITSGKSPKAGIIGRTLAGFPGTRALTEAGRASALSSLGAVSPSLPALAESAAGRFARLPGLDSLSSQEQPYSSLEELP